RARRRGRSGAGRAEQVVGRQGPLVGTVAHRTGGGGPLRAPAVRPVPARGAAGALPSRPHAGIVHLRPARRGGARRAGTAVQRGTRAADVTAQGTCRVSVWSGAEVGR